MHALSVSSTSLCFKRPKQQLNDILPGARRFLVAFDERDQKHLLFSFSTFNVTSF